MSFRQSKTENKANSKIYNRHQVENISIQKSVDSDSKNQRVLHCVHKLQQKVSLPVRQRCPFCEQHLLLISQLQRVPFGEELCQSNTKRRTHRLQDRQRGGVVSLEHICDGGVGRARFLCQPVLRPAALHHHVFDSALYVHIITCLSVTIIVPEMVL